MAERLHIYAQQQWHDEAYIVGERDRLESLRDAITVALETGQCKVLAFCNDGEGYDLHVICLREEQADRLAVPYTSECAHDFRESAVWPWDASLKPSNDPAQQRRGHR